MLQAMGGALSAEQLLRKYCTHVYAQCSYIEAVRRLEMDRRTVAAKVDHQLLGRMQQGGFASDADGPPSCAADGYAV